jgi:hypothetical protein
MCEAASSAEEPPLLRRVIFLGTTRRSSNLWAHAREFGPRVHLIFFHETLPTSCLLC